jgi:hypothetical protein
MTQMGDGSVLELVVGTDFEEAVGLRCLYCGEVIHDRPARLVPPGQWSVEPLISEQSALFVLEEHITFRHPQELPFLRGRVEGHDYTSSAAGPDMWRQECLLCGQERTVENGSWIAAHFQLAHWERPVRRPLAEGDAEWPSRVLKCEGCGKVIHPPVPRMEAQDRDGNVIGRWHRPSHAHSFTGPSEDHRYVFVTDAAPPPADPEVAERVRVAAERAGLPLHMAGAFPGPPAIAAIARDAAVAPIDVVYQYAYAFGFALPSEPDDPAQAGLA